MLFARILLLGGLAGVGHFLGLQLFSIAQIFVAFNLWLWVFSYIFRYEDGKKIFQVAYYLALALLLVILWSHLTSQYFLDLVSLFWWLHLGVVAFFVFVVGIARDIEEYMWYKLFILIVGMVLLVISNSASDLYVAIFLNTLMLTWVYVGVFYLKRIRLLSPRKQEDISLRRILAWEKILGHGVDIEQTKPLQFLAHFVHGMPKLSQYALEAMNILLIAWLSIFYVLSIDKGVSHLHQLLFWVTIALYTLNVVLLKKLQYTSVVQKLVVFSVINFAIYASLMMVFDKQFGQIAIWGIARNLLSTLMIFYTPKTSIGALLQKRDYVFWILTTTIALIANIVFLSQAKLQGQLLFSLIFFYLGLEAMIMFYALKYVKKL